MWLQMLWLHTSMSIDVIEKEKIAHSHMFMNDDMKWKNMTIKSIDHGSEFMSYRRKMVKIRVNI